MTTINFTKALQDAKGASFEALPVGDYDIEVAKAEAVTSSNGKPMIKTNMKVVAGPYEKRPIINNFVLSIENAQAVAIFFRHMKAFGITEEFFASLGANGSLDAVASALVGRRARLTLGHREWNGENRNEVKSVKPYTGAPPMAGPLSAGLASGGMLPGPSIGSLPAGPTAMTTPIAPPSPTPATPAAPVAPAVAAAPVAAPTPPAVQAMPQPPVPAQEVSAPVPTSTTTDDTVVDPSTYAPPQHATSEPVAAPTPPALPF